MPLRKPCRLGTGMLPQTLRSATYMLHFVGEGGRLPGQHRIRAEEEEQQGRSAPGL